MDYYFEHRFFYGMAMLLARSWVLVVSIGVSSLFLAIAYVMTVARYAKQSGSWLCVVLVRSRYGHVAMHLAGRSVRAKDYLDRTLCNWTSAFGHQYPHLLQPPYGWWIGGFRQRPNSGLVVVGCVTATVLLHLQCLVRN